MYKILNIFLHKHLLHPYKNINYRKPHKMEDAFNKLKKEGKNNVDALVKLMQDNKVVETTKASEERARKLFQDVKNQANVDYKTFQEALAKLAADEAKSAENLAQNLSAEGSKFMQATTAAAKAAAETFKDAMKK